MKRSMKHVVSCVSLGLLLAGPALAQDDLLIAEPGSANLWTSSGPVGKRPEYSRTLIHRGVESCVAVSMVIEADGSTSSHRVLKLAMRPQARENDAKLRALVEEWGVSMAKMHRYTPGPDNPKAEAAYTSQSFAAGRGGKPDSLMPECEITDLRSAVAAVGTGEAGSTKAQ